MHIFIIDMPLNFSLLPVTERDPVLLALPLSFSAKHVYLPSSDLVTLWISRLPSSQMKILTPLHWVFSLLNTQFYSKF